MGWIGSSRTDNYAIMHTAVCWCVGGGLINTGSSLTTISYREHLSLLESLFCL